MKEKEGSFFMGRFKLRCAVLLFLLSLINGSFKISQEFEINFGDVAIFALVISMFAGISSISF